MLNRHIIGNVLVELAPEKVNRRLNLPRQEKKLEKEIIRAIEQVTTAAQATAIISEFEIIGVTDPIVTFGDSHEIKSGHISRLLASCRRLYLFAMTLGPDVDRLIDDYFKNRNESAGYIIDAAASEYIEAAVQFIHDFLIDRGRRLRGEVTPRFSPGYGDFTLENQRGIVQMLDARRIGITLQEPSLLMSPRKSVTAVCGLRL